MKIIVYFFLFFLSLKVNAISLSDQLNIFFKKEYPVHKNNINVRIRTPLKKNIFCKKPFFSLINNLNDLGLVDVLLTCGAQHQYLKVELQVKGKYITANRKILRGTKIQESDLKVVIGRLDALPNHAYLKKKDIINSVSVRDILPLQPITSFMVRPYWLVKINQSVTVIIKGIDFKIITKGKSLKNAAVNENIRIKIENGKIINGTVNKKGEVIMDS